MPKEIKLNIDKFEELRVFYQKFLIDSNVNSLNLELKQPNIFNILKIEGAEIRHSNFLAWLLNPQESHGLGETIFKRLIIELFFHEKSNKINDHLIHDIDYSKVEIFREWNNIDILMKCPLLNNEKNNLIICIENKVKSKDSEGQLDKYFKKVNDNFPSNINEIIFVYLTLYGDEPTQKVDNLSYIFFSYIKIKDIIEETLKIYDSNISIKIKSYIEDYLSSIKRNFMEQDKTIDYAKRIYKEHKELIDFILEKGIDNKFRLSVENFCEERGLKIIDKGNNHTSFIPINWFDELENFNVLGEEKHRGKGFPLAFEFEKKPGSMNLSLTVYPFKNQETRKEFIIKIQELFRSNGLNINTRQGKKGMWTRIISSNIKDIKSWDEEDTIQKNCSELYKKIEEKIKKIQIKEFLKKYSEE
jgi:hypothetical protein